MDASFQRLARRQLSEALARYIVPSRTPRPRDGWIAAIRESLDMTVRQLATRLRVSPSSIVRMEQRERDDTISLGALRRAANALDCDLVYAVVPRRAAGSEPTSTLLDTLIEARAHEVAAVELSRIAHTMALEGQAVNPADMQAQIAERTAALAETPRRLWDANAVTSATRPANTQRRRPK